MCGMLMADLYVEKIKFPGPSWAGFIIGIASLILLPFIDRITIPQAAIL